MSKRRLGNEIDELSDDILGDLEPEQRLQLLLSAQADGNDQRLDRLIESCPRYKYTATNRAFANRAWLARRIAQQAVYDLHTTYLHYELTRQQQFYTQILDCVRDEEVSDEDSDRTSERADELCVLFTKLYTNYHAYQRFATEILNVDPKTWLAPHPKGPTVFEVVTDVIDNEWEIEFAESSLNEQSEEQEEVDEEIVKPDQTAPVDDGEVSLKDVAEVQYEVLASDWEDAVAKIS